MLDKLTQNTALLMTPCLKNTLNLRHAKGAKKGKKAGNKERKLALIVRRAISREAHIRSGKCHFNAPVLFQQNPVWELAAPTTRFSQ